MKYRYPLLAAGLCLLLNACYQPKEADLIVHNAYITTMDLAMPTAQAMAVVDGRIVELGPEREIMNRYRSRQKLDARKQHIYPGFIDAHSHFMGYATNKAELNLYGVESEAAMYERVQAFAKWSQRHWIIGRGWDQNLWPGARWPTRAALDSLFPDRPVYLMRIDGHAVLVNGEALRRAGIDGRTALPGGRVLLDANGEPTGVLIDHAFESVRAVIPPLSRAELIQLLADAEADCFSAGLTSVTDAGLPVNSVELLDSLHRAGLLRIRINAFLSPTNEAQAYMQRGPYTSDRLTVRTIKLYADGALGSRGALLKAPYSDEPSQQGLALMSQAEFNLWAERCVAHGYQLATHAIGDSANAWVLRTYANHLGGMNDLRWRVEHAQVVSPADRALFGQYAIIPSVQPVHATSDAPWSPDRLGEGRINHGYAYASLERTLGVLPLGTDFPVEPIDPLDTYFAAVTRKKPRNTEAAAFLPNEALSRESALKGMTLWAAMAAFEENQKGTLAPGMWADFVVVNRDLLTASEVELAKARVVETWLAGERVSR